MYLRVFVKSGFLGSFGRMDLFKDNNGIFIIKGIS